MAGSDLEHVRVHSAGKRKPLLQKQQGFSLSALGRLTKSLVSGEPAVSQRQPVASERRPWDVARQALDLVTLRGFRRDARGYGFGTKAYAKIRASLLACSIKRFCVPSVTIVPRPL